MTGSSDRDLFCSRGHRWPAPVFPPSLLGGISLVCPECGAPAQDSPGDDDGACGETRVGSPPTHSPRSAFPEATPCALSGQAPAVEPVPGYTILGRLGRGGMGVVYKARQENLKRIVALKMIDLGPAPEAELLRRFRNEAEIVARLHHPNIIQVYDIGGKSDHPYMALECVEGGSLRDRIKGRPQPPRAAARVAEILARAVGFAHSRGVVHRDLKPANVLLAPLPADGTGDQAAVCQEGVDLYGVPKVADFGLAKRLDDDQGATGQGEVLGTPLYMAPEQAEGKSGQVGAACDVYALGVILYELLTGRVPFRGETALETLEQVRTAAPTPPRRFRPEVDADLETVCLKCLAKSPGDRYASAVALAEDLARYLRGEPVRARPPTWAARAWSWSLRNPMPASLLVTVTVALAAGGLGWKFLSEYLVQRSAAESAEHEARAVLQVWDLYSSAVKRADGPHAFGTHHFRLSSDSTPPGELKYTGGEKGRAAMPNPATFIILLGEKMHHSDPDAGLPRAKTRIRVYSDFPIRDRGTESPPTDDFGKAALKALAGEPSKPSYYRFDTNEDGRRQLRFAFAVPVRKGCQDCHNKASMYAPGMTTKTDWQLGETRGVLEIIRPMDRDYGHIHRSLLLVGVGLVGGALVLLGVTWRVLQIGRRRRGL